MALDGTYSGLQASVADFLNRADLTAVIPDFIALAEAQISRRLVMMGPVRRMMGRSDASITSEFASVPTDFMGARAFYLTGGSGRICELDYCDPEEINNRKQHITAASGCPRVFSVVGGEFQFFPAPSSSFAAELTYWKRIPALSDAAPTNWLLTINPDAYLYGALLQAAPYLKDDARIQVWEPAFETILGDIVASDKMERTAARLSLPFVTGQTP